jgi:hypothetical protein
MEFAGRISAPAPVAAALVNYTDDGREAIAFTFDCAAWSRSCQMLGRMAVAWMLEPRPAKAAAATGGAIGGAATGGAGAGGAINATSANANASGGAGIPTVPSLTVPGGISAIVAACSGANATVAACQAAAAATGQAGLQIIADVISQIRSANETAATGAVAPGARAGRGAWGVALGALLLLGALVP